MKKVIIASAILASAIASVNANAAGYSTALKVPAGTCTTTADATNSASLLSAYTDNYTSEYVAADANTPNVKLSTDHTGYNQLKVSYTLSTDYNITDAATSLFATTAEGRAKLGASASVKMYYDNNGVAAQGASSLNVAVGGMSASAVAGTFTPSASTTATNFTINNFKSFVTNGGSNTLNDLVTGTDGLLADLNIVIECL